MAKLRLKELLGEYQAKTGETLRYEDINEAIGISPNTLSLMATNKTDAIRFSTLDNLAAYLSLKLKRVLTTSDILVLDIPTPIADQLRAQLRANLQAQVKAEDAPNA